MIYRSRIRSLLRKTDARGSVDIVCLTWRVSQHCASGTLNDVTNYATHRICNTKWQYCGALLILYFDKNVASLAGFNTTKYDLLMVLRGLVFGTPCVRVCEWFVQGEKETAGVELSTSSSQFAIPAPQPLHQHATRLSEISLRPRINYC